MPGRKSLIFISSSSSVSGGDFLLKAGAMGFSPRLFCADPDRFVFLRNGFAQNAPFAVDLIDVNDRQAVETRLREIARHETIAGVLSTSDYYVATAAAIAQSMGLPGPNPQAVEACRDKAHQRRVYTKAGLTQPRWIEVSTPDEAARAAQALGGNVVIKPVAYSGCIGVRLATDEAGVRRAAGELLAQTENDRGQPTPHEILVEEFLTGPDYVIEMFHGEVMGIVEKLPVAEPHFAAIAHTFPAALSSASRAELERIARVSVRELGLTFGPVDIDAKLVGGAAVIIETNPRLGGGLIPRLFELTKTDLIGWTIAAFTSEPAMPAAARFPAAASRFLLPARPGRLVELNGIQEARRACGVQEVLTYVQCGASLALRGDVRDRIGHVVAVGASAAEAAENAALAAAQIHVVTEP